MSSTLSTRIEEHIVGFYASHPHPFLTYHSLDHTRAVVNATRLLADHYRLSDDEHMAAMAAAWFHDLGYMTNPLFEHEDASIALAADFLQSEGVAPSVITLVGGCIRATKMPQAPNNRTEEILCDADMIHLGQADYQDQQKQLRNELERLGNEKVSGREWRQQNIQLLQSHTYFTPYARTLWGEGQAANLQRQLEKQAEKGEQLQPPPDLMTDVPKTPVLVKKSGSVRKKGKKKTKKNRPERGIETLFRTTSTNHLQLSEIADSKANIMISVNAIMVSVVVSVLPRRIEENPALVWPTVLFLAASLLTIVFAILTTRPNVTHGTFSRDDILQKRGNLLFFGNFHQMSLSDYEWGISELMKDGKYLYGTLTRDIYHLGIVLGKKYRLLRITYTIFMVGFVISILAFLIVFLFFSHALPV